MNYSFQDKTVEINHIILNRDLDESIYLENSIELKWTNAARLFSLYCKLLFHYIAQLYCFKIPVTILGVILAKPSTKVKEAYIMIDFYLNDKTLTDSSLIMEEASTNVSHNV